MAPSYKDIDTASINTPMNPQMDHTNCCVPCAQLARETRDSQLRTEELVKNFIESMSKNPMMKMMAGKFGA